jgi:rare lipoprotein A
MLGLKPQFYAFRLHRKLFLFANFMKPEALAGLFLCCTFCVAQSQSASVPTTNEVIQASTPIPSIEPSRLPVQTGHASWYGESHRGRLMANGRRFDPDKLTAASWFYPLGSRVRVSLKTDPRLLNPQPERSVWVTITDRGPHRRLVRNGRIIDLSYGVFRRLADPDLGLIEVIVHPEIQPPQVAQRSAG